MQNYACLNDADLLRKVHRGDDQAFAFIYTTYWPVLYPVASKCTDDARSARDIVHDIFLVLLEKKDMVLKPGQSILQFLMRCMRNKTIDYIRRYESATKYVRHLEACAEREDIMGDVEARDMYGSLLQVIDRMPATLKQIAEMCLLKGMERKEIAEALGKNPDNVKRRISEARGIVADHFEKHFFFAILGVAIAIQKIIDFFS
jgi:RNA polymerase sigma factor (sigma-70 family)